MFLLLYSRLLVVVLMSVATFPLAIAVVRVAVTVGVSGPVVAAMAMMATTAR